MKLSIKFMLVAILFAIIGCSDSSESSSDPTETQTVAFSGITANGTSSLVTTSELTLTFDDDPESLAIDNIDVTGATKGNLNGTGTTRTLTISNITVANESTLTVTVNSPTGYTITDSTKTVAVFLVAVIPAAKITRVDNPSQGGFGGYYAVTLTQSSAASHKDLGIKYGEAILIAAPDLQSSFDGYLVDLGLDTAKLSAFIDRVNALKTKIPQDYIDEIDGIASSISNTTSDVPGDKKLSANEVWVLNLLPDVGRATACSGFGAWGSASEGGVSRIFRNLDWSAGSLGRIIKYQAVVTIKGTSTKSITLIGYLGMLSVISGINSDGVFGAILDSTTGALYSATGKRSYTLDLRTALETYSTKDTAGAYMRDTAESYPYNHNLLLADANGTIIVENNVSGTRAIRNDTSTLNSGITWGISKAAGVVNSFVLSTSANTHTQLYNTARWDSLKTRAAAGTGSGGTLNENDLKLMSGYKGSDATIGNGTNGGLYLGDSTFWGNQQCIYFEPATKKLEIAFRPAYDAANPTRSGTATAQGLPLVPVFMSVPTGL